MKPVKTVETNEVEVVEVPVVTAEQVKNEIANQSQYEVVEKSNIMSDEALGHFYSMTAETTEQKIALYNAINTPDARLSDSINMEIKIKDLLVEIIELADQNTGEMIKVPRTIIVDTEGKTYQCVSIGVFSSLKRIINLFGEPTWEQGVPVTVKQITKGQKSLLSLAM